ncbi:SDH family Clp fold serine proteinase [Saccharolobus shibatae]|uniref:Serine dehydrogenase proteinase n=1 Tax=Saccharolobus shibatae TaxID=2286 RepID=A0A8F5GW94_9CREN|nr:ATP-dependent Clp protease proteolytic subunit [Saccharolobus shibatae]QXJ31844.1 hypothetical protein J5U21_01495 [Saccharolobus shibatae]
MDNPIASPIDVQIIWADKQAFMETVYGLRSKELMFIIHSPGGQIEATQSIIEYLRQKFDRITVVVPDAAMSAATLFALASDEVIMGKHSNLGPIDPQFVVTMPYGQVSISAQSVLEEFERAKEEVKKDRDSLLVWAPKIQQYPPGILEEARNALELTKKLGREWLVKYMFKGDADAEKKAERIVNYLSDHKELKSHATPISRDKLKELGLKITDLENDQNLQDLILSVYHITRITFQLTTAHKIVENSNGRAFIKLVLAGTPEKKA